MAVITNFSLLGAVSTVDAPYTIGHAFKKGDVPAGVDVLGNGTNFQCIPKNYWSDGSLKFAVISGRISTTAGAPVVVTLATGTAVAGTALTLTNLKATGLTVTFGAGTFGSATFAGTDFDTFQKQTESGPVMSSWRFRKPIGTDDHLVAWMEVRLYVGGAVDVFPWIENGYLKKAAPTNKLETFTVDINSTQVFSYNTDYKSHMRMVAINGTNLSYWTIADPQITPLLDTAYMESSRVVPTYRQRTPATATTVTSLPSTYVPFQQGKFPSAMGAGGATESIGILPNHDALYITCPSKKTYDSVVRHGFSAGRYKTHFRDETTNEPLRPSQYPNLVLNRTTQKVIGIGISVPEEYTPAETGGGLYQFIATHHPSMGYMAYLLTGRYYFIEEAQMLNTFTFLCNSDFERNNTEWIVRPDAGANTTRGAAWILARMVQAAALSPDGDTVGEELRTSWANNINYMDAKYIAQPNCPFGFTHIYTDYGVTDNIGLQGSGFQCDFFTSALGFGKSIEVPVAAPVKAKLDALFTWKAQSIIGRLGSFGATEFPYTKAGEYSFPLGPNQLKITDPPDGRPATDWEGGTGPWWPDWGVVYEKLFGATPKVDAPLANYNFPEWHSAWGTMLPAIAYSVEHGVPGASAAYTRLTSASNWNLQESSFVNYPVYGIQPASDTYVAPDPVIEPEPLPQEPITMPIAFTDIKLRRAGPVGLGGVISTTDVGSAMFDDVQGTEATAGRTEYRCAYVYNAHPTDTMLGAVAWIASNTPSTSTIIEIGLGAAAMSATEQTVNAETTAPLGVTFVAGDTKATGVALGDIPPLGHRAVWYRRTTAPGAPARAADGWTPRVESGGG